MRRRLTKLWTKLRITHSICSAHCTRTLIPRIAKKKPPKLALASPSDSPIARRQALALPRKTLDHGPGLRMKRIQALALNGLQKRRQLQAVADAGVAVVVAVGAVWTDGILPGRASEVCL